MSDIEGPASPATGTAGIMDSMTAEARPSSREPDSRDPGDIESGRMGVDLLFLAIGAGLCPDDSVLAPDRDRILWNAVEQLRSHVGRLESRLEHRLREPTPEQQEERTRENEDNAGDAEFLRADQAEATQAQIGILRDTLDHAMHRYGEAIGRPWIARHGTVDPGPSEHGLGVQIDASTFFAAREIWQPAPKTLDRVRETMEEADLKRAALLAAAENRDRPNRLEDIPFPYNAGERQVTAAAVARMFQALSLIYPNGTQLQDERDAGSWRLVRLFDAGAARAIEDALRRMTEHPALGPSPDPDAAASFDDGTHSSMLRVQMLSRAADAAGALYQETTGNEWDRRDPSMTAAGGPRIRTSLTSRHYAAAQRVAALGHPTPHQLDGPHIVIVGSADLDMDRNRRTVESQLERLHARVPEMVLHYGDRLRDRGGVDRQQGIDAIVHRWATGRGVPLIPNPPLWDAANNRFDLHSRDDAWIFMNPDLVVDFGGSGNAHRRFVSLVNQNGIEMRTARTRSQSQSAEHTAGTVHEAQQQPEMRTAQTPPASRTYDIARSCVFRTTRGQWGIFSNFTRLPDPISAADRNFATSEHLYQASKFRQSPEVQMRIAGVATARGATKIGRAKGNPPDADWNERRIDAMRWVIRMKREANPELVNATLEKTGNRPIVEYSKNDSFWGARPEGDALVGQNILGRLWTELRQQIRDGDPRAFAASWDNPLTPTVLSAGTVARSVSTNVPKAQAERFPVDVQPRTIRWAGIGARKTPDQVLTDMTSLARRMSDAGFHLASGGARGADTAFATGVPADRRTIWLPWAGYNNLRGPECQTIPPERLQECMDVARRLHPNWDNCSPQVRQLHARNVAILLGPNLDNPVDAVVCWTEGGRARGGTGIGMRIAQDWNIPVINLATVSAQDAWASLQRLQDTPQSTPAAASATRDRADPDQRRALRRRRAVTRIRGMLRDHDITNLPRFALAELREETARTVAHERLDSMSRDQLLDALDKIQDQTRQLREKPGPAGPATPETVERDQRIAALEAAGDRIHAVLADKNLSALRDQESPETAVSSETQRRVLSVMVSAWRLAEEGPLATQSNRIVKAAAQIFSAQQTILSGKLADETRIRSGLGLTHTPGSEEEARALASRGPGQNSEKEAEPFEHMLTDVEIKQKDEEYHTLALRGRGLDLMAETARTFAQAAHQDMRGGDRDQRTARHLEGAHTPSAIQERQDELRAAHRQLIDDAYRNIVSLCPDDHVSAADPNHTASSDRDQLLSRFAGILRGLERDVDAALMNASRTGKGTRNIGQLREVASWLRDLARYAEQTLEKHTRRPPHTWTRRTTQTAGEWLMERQRRALHRQKAESLAPNGRHVAIVGGRRLGRQHAGRIAEFLNRERAANPDKPLVLHCIAQEGAGRFAAEWAASHGVTCVAHRPQRYTPNHLKRRDNLLLSIPPDTVWNFGSEGDHERAAKMLLERAAEHSNTLPIRDMAAELDAPLSGTRIFELREQAGRDYAHIHHAWQKANALAGNAPLIYQDGVKELLPDINRTLASPHLAGKERRFLTSLKSLIESEDRLRGDISNTIDRARNHLASYQAILERRGPHGPGEILNDVDPHYRKWDVRAEMIVKTFDNWFAIDNPVHREHIDRRRLDLVDLAEELRAIRRAARDPQTEPHRVEIALDSIGRSEDQRFDRRHFTELTLKATRPEDERSPQVAAEFARWARAWPEKAHATFRHVVAEAAEAKLPLHAERLAASLPPRLAAGMSHISNEVWGQQARAMMQRHAARSHGRGLSA